MGGGGGVGLGSRGLGQAGRRMAGDDGGRGGGSIPEAKMGYRGRLVGKGVGVSQWGLFFGHLGDGERSGRGETVDRSETPRRAALEGCVELPDEIDGAFRARRAFRARLRGG